jgi:SOS response regulatory protein OraA/RecX
MKTRTTKSQYAQALDLLTRYLALRDHSRYELQSKLSKRFEPEIVSQVLAEAEAAGWIAEDAVIAERAARSWRNKLKSRRYIEGQLKKRHLPLPARDPESEMQTARALLEKRFGPARELSFDDKGKAYRYMKYRGFDDRTIRMVLNGQEF